MCGVVISYNWLIADYPAKRMAKNIIFLILFRDSIQRTVQPLMLNVYLILISEYSFFVINEEKWHLHFVLDMGG